MLKMTYAQYVWTHLRKDLQLEWRARDPINGMLFFALLVVVVLAIAFDPAARDQFDFRHRTHRQECSRRDVQVPDQTGPAGNDGSVTASRGTSLGSEHVKHGPYSPGGTFFCELKGRRRRYVISRFAVSGAA